MKLIFVLLIGIVAVAYSDDSQLVNKFVSGNRRFAADVYKQLIKVKSTENFLFCPVSAEIILALTLFGAKGQTAQQMANALRVTEDKQELENTFKQLIPSLKGNENYTLASANRIYIKDGYKIHEDFKNVTKNTFDAEIQNINFENKKSAANEMNSWVERKTHEKIKNLIDPEMLNKDSRAVLLNALYFKATWVTKFDETNTQKKTFFLNLTHHVDVDMMSTTDYYKYMESSELKAKFLEMRYAGGNISMVIVLPDDKDGLSALENKIDQVIDTVVKAKQKVNVQLPKFKEETKIKLGDILKTLGIKDAFEDYADFSGFGAPGQDPLKISDVVQKTFLEVDEKGTTAAAATAVHTVRAYSATVDTPPKEFNVDHPFIYYIKSPLGVMFIGRYRK